MSRTLARVTTRSTEMHDYTARIIHEDRMADFRREADASRLAWAARQDQSRPNVVARLRRLARLVAGRRRGGASDSSRPRDIVVTPAAE